ncbi:MAG: fasciclin domain-containing protein [Sphingomonas bacterium]|nr:fasciclin domain-containing protein [Sphingomonas bacterium]
MRIALTLFAAASAMTVAACDTKSDNSSAPKSEAARDAAGDKTIASGLGADDSKFAAAAKASGLDATLAGPGPYTVLVPVNGAFDKLPAGALDTLLKPESRAQLTKVLTGHILPGAILAEDIGKAIDNGKGKASLATFGGGTITATRDGDKIVLTDSAGAKAIVTGTDDKRSNGVVHHIDGVLMPS